MNDKQSALLSLAVSLYLNSAIHFVLSDLCKETSNDKIRVLNGIFKSWHMNGSVKMYRKHFSSLVWSTGLWN